MNLSCRVVAAWCALAASSAFAQTIADYSRAQRAVLETAMVQAAARSAGLAASAPAVPAQAPVASAPPTAPAARPPALQSVAGPRVSGVFASAAGMVVEVDVDGAPYVLAAGQAVPGTPWRVESATIDRVVLARRESDATGASSGAVEPARRVFALPPLR